MNQISYINKVEVTEAKNLDNFNSYNGWAWLPTTVPFTEIPISGLATLTTEESVSDKSVVFTTSLNFVADTTQLPRWDKRVFRLTATDGTRRLMGDNARPWVQTVATTEHPESVGSPVKTTVKATWTGPRKPPVLK
jgi:hypothetical protein